MCYYEEDCSATIKLGLYHSGFLPLSKNATLHDVSGNLFSKRCGVLRVLTMEKVLINMTDKTYVKLLSKFRYS
jgi:hypothetical protein